MAQGRANPPPKGFALYSFRLLSDAGSAIIRPVSRKAILGTLIFDIGDSRMIAAAGLKEWVSDGVEFLAARNAKFAKA